ncbi:MAG: hypothetical protein ACQSGP_12375 [Frankia sp.]
MTSATGRPTDEGGVATAEGGPEAGPASPATLVPSAVGSVHGGSGQLPVRWAPPRRSNLPGPGLDDEQAWRVGFSPSGDVLPDTLADVLSRGSHAVRSTQRAEAQRRERATAVADHVERQISDFLAICAAENLDSGLTVRVHGGMPRRGRRRRNRTFLTVPPPRGWAVHRYAGLRRTGVRVWPVLYWHTEGFPSAGRSLHLFIGADGNTFEGLDDPGPLRVMGRQVRAWPVDVREVVQSMAEVDARRCAHQLVQGLAVLLWQDGVGL